MLKYKEKAMKENHLNLFVAIGCLRTPLSTHQPISVRESKIVKQHWPKIFRDVTTKKVANGQVFSSNPPKSATSTVKNTQKRNEINF